MDYSFATEIVIVVGLIACATDLALRRIPNVLTFGAAIAALVYGAVHGGEAGLVAAVGGWIAGVLIFLPLFVLGGMGAGDVKLLAAIGAWLGLPAVFWIAIYTSIAGGAIAIAVALARGYLRTAVGNIAMMFRYWSVAGPRPVAGLTLDTPTAVRLPYALPIFIGTVIALWLR